MIKAEHINVDVFVTRSQEKKKKKTSHEEETGSD